MAGAHDYPTLPFDHFIMGLDAIASSAPVVIDSSCWSRVPSLRKHSDNICKALYTLEFIDREGRHLKDFEELLKPSRRHAVLQEHLRKIYRFIDATALKAMTRRQLDAAFQQEVGRLPIGKKMASFFVKAAHLAGIPIAGELTPRRPRQKRAAVLSGQAPGGRVEEILAEVPMGQGFARLLLVNEELKNLSTEEFERLADTRSQLLGRKPARNQGAPEPVGRVDERKAK